jgi:Predicted flavoprotein
MKKNIMFLFCFLGLPIMNSALTTPISLKIILGSTRHGRSSDKIGKVIQDAISSREDIVTEIIDLRDYHLSFIDDAISPSSRKSITDPSIQKWSDTISHADAFIIVLPVYNMGYPGVLKNALDLLYKEWNNKPVAFVSYSGGTTGGTTVITQLKEVALELKMIPITTSISIPQTWKAFDRAGSLIYPNFKTDLDRMVDQLITAHK